MNSDYDYMYADDDYYNLDYPGMDYLFSANVSSSSFAEKTISLLDLLRKENSVVTFTFSDGTILNTSDINNIDKDLGDVQIEFMSQINDLNAQINVFEVSETETEIVMMLPHEEIKKLEHERIIFETAKKFFECLTPKYGVTGEQVYAQPADEIADDDFIHSFDDIGYISSYQFNMASRAKKYKSKFTVYPVCDGELFVSKDFDKELHKGEKKKCFFHRG